MKNKLIIFSCLIQLSILGSLYAQKDLQGGYVVFHNGDTIKGLVDIKSNIGNSTKCMFYPEGSNELKNYTPEDIQEYRVFSGKYYVSKMVKIREEEEKKRFVEYLVNGIVDLYYLKDVVYEAYLIEKDGVLYQLTNDAVDVENKYGVKHRVNTNKHIGILNYLFQDSEETLSKVPGTDFAYSSLIKITKEYHNAVCTEYDCIDYTKAFKNKGYIELFGGSMNSWMGLVSSDDLIGDHGFYTGIFFGIKPPKIHHLWDFKIGFIYSGNHFGGQWKNTLYDEQEKIYEMDLSYKIYRVPLMVQYNFPLKPFQPFISIGYENIFIQTPVYNISKIIQGTYSIKPYIFEESSDFRAYQMGFLARMGARYHMKGDYYFVAGVDAEYRFPSANYRHILDFHRVYSLGINAGIGKNF